MQKLQTARHCCFLGFSKLPFRDEFENGSNPSSRAALWRRGMLCSVVWAAGAAAPQTGCSSKNGKLFEILFKQLQGDSLRFLNIRVVFSVLSYLRISGGHSCLEVGPKDPNPRVKSGVRARTLKPRPNLRSGRFARALIHRRHENANPFSLSKQN